VYAKVIDGMDPFEFFRDFFNKTNDMKSLQGKLFVSRMFTGASFFPITFYPPSDNDFNEHSVTFSDDSVLKFNIVFRNSRGPKPTTRDLDTVPTIDLTPKGGPDSDVIDAVKNFKRVSSSKRVRDQNKYVLCDASGDMNWILLNTFMAESTEDIDVYLNEAADCVEEFDKNKKPIAILLLRNGGGYDVISTIVRSWLLPTSDARYLKAVKKTSKNKALVKKYYSGGISDLETCKLLGIDDFEPFWSETEMDYFGEGAVHVRSQKFYDNYYTKMEALKQYGLVKNPRKPTDVVLVTDGYCFSACSYFANSVMEVGSAITAGIGISNIGDEKFVSSQCPSNVASPLYSFFYDLQSDAKTYGISVGVTLGETFHIESNNNGTQIPRDFTVSRIDENIGDFFLSFAPEEVVAKALELQKDYQKKCNPDNQHLLMYTSKCKKTDSHAKQMGYACGDNGKWDTSKCRVAVCKPGWVVDFENNSCMRNPCEEEKPDSADSIAHFGSAMLLIFALFFLLF